MGLRQFLTAEIPLKMMKNAFYFILKALFVLKIFKFLSAIFFMKQFALIRKLRLTLISGKQTITIHILPNISRGKFSQTMKFSRLMEYNVRNIFLQKSWENLSARLLSAPICFFKKALHKIQAKVQHVSCNMW